MSTFNSFLTKPSPFLPPKPPIGGPGPAPKKPGDGRIGIPEMPGSPTDPGVRPRSISSVPNYTLPKLLTAQATATPTPAKSATGLTFTPGGSGGTGAGTSIGAGGVPRWFQPPKTAAPQPGLNATDAAATAAMSDLDRTQAAADDQYKQVKSAIEAVKQTVAKGSGAITAGANQASQILQKSSDQNTAGLKQLGDSQVAEVRKEMEALKADIAQQNAATLSNFKDMTAQTASATARGIGAQYEQAIAMSTKGIGPDGVPMSPTEQADMQHRARTAANEQTQSALTGIYSHFNDAQANLRLNLSAQTMQAGAIAIGALGEAHAGQRGLYTQAAQLGSSLDQARAQIANATPFAALNYELNGQMAIAQMIRENPQSVVSYFSTIAALTNLATAPGVGNIRFDFSKFVGGRP